ncbi:MAG: carbohydrate-binding domain-containing protein [Bacteroidales bacterium]|nr:carbohydrate-binding domain-containing protein [Bacteroidales bacterium]
MKTKYECRASVALAALMLALSGCIQDEILYAGTPDSDAVSENTSSGSSSSGTSSSGGSSASGTETAPVITVEEVAADLVANTTFDRTIRIVYAAAGATVTGDENKIVSVNGNDVTVDNTGDTAEKVKFVLSGKSSDGFFKVYNSQRQAIVLDGLDLKNPAGAAINNQGKKRCFVVVQGENALADGASYTDTPSDEDEKGVFFSEGQLVFSGDGSLTVTATGKSGIVSDDYVRFLAAPVVKVTSSAGHGIRGKDAVIVTDGTLKAEVSAQMKKGVSSDSLVRFEGGSTTLNITGGAAYDSEDKDYSGSAGVKADQVFQMLGGSLTVTNSGTGGKGISGDGPGYFQGGTVSVTVTGSNYGSSSSGGRPGGSSSGSSSVAAKGIKFDGDLYFTGASVQVSAKAHEGIESKGTILVSDGMVSSVSSGDDAINAGSTFTIEGGFVSGISSANDGLDANGNLYIKGGVVYAAGAGSPEVAVDANTEGGYKLYVEGGVLFAIGGLESGASLSQGCYSASSWSRGTWYGVTVGSTSHAFKTPSSGGAGLIVSGASQPSVHAGVTATGGTASPDGAARLDCTFSGGSAVSLSAYSGGGGGWGGGGWGPR